MHRKLILLWICTAPSGKTAPCGIISSIIPSTVISIIRITFSLRSVSAFSFLLYLSCSFKYERFSFNPFKIKNVKAKSGGYEIFPTEISANSDITVEYYYFPKAEDYSEEYSFKGVCDETDIAYGILAEYLLYKGRYSEGSTYFDKFINALSSYSRAQKKSKLKSREWF